jgi:hypothetical protein
VIFKKTKDFLTGYILNHIPRHQSRFNHLHLSESQQALALPKNLTQTFIYTTLDDLLRCVVSKKKKKKKNGTRSRKRVSIEQLSSSQ